MPSGLRRLFGGGGGHGGGSRGVAGGGGAGSGGSGGGGAGSGGGGAPPSQAEPAASPAPPPPPPLPAYDGLDLCYVTPRLIVCGRPSARSTDIADHRNNVTALAAFLDKRHGGDYLVFNLSNKNRNAIDYGRFGNQVLEHQPYSPLGIVDDAPAVAQCFRILYSLLFWLEWGPETVAVLHCNSGVFRSGFIAACYLRYTGAAASIDEGLARFTSARFPPPPPPPPPPPGTAAPLEPPPGDDEAGGSAASAVLLGASGTLATVAVPALATAAASAGGSIAPRLYASWRFLQRHLEAAMGAPASIPRVHKLSYLILALPGLTTGTDGDVPVVVQLYQGPKVAFDSSKDCSALEDALRWEEGKLIVELPHPGGLTLCGDYQLWVLVAGARASESRLLAEHPTHPSFESTTPTPSMAAAPGGGLLGGVTLTDDEGAGGGGGVTPAETDGGGVGRLQPRDASGAGGVFNRSHHRRRGRRLVARLLFHSSVLDSGVVSFGEAECDIFHPKMERRAFSLSLVLDEVPPEVVNESNLACVCKRSFLNLRGDKALAQGAIDLSAHHYVFPDAKLRQQMTGEGLDDVAVVCALQRAGNAAGRAREFLDVPLFKTLFKESQAMRDLKLLRETLTLDEIAGVLAARSNMVVKRKGLQLGDLDFSSLLEAAKLGNLREEGGGGGGGGGPGGGGGKGSGGRRKRLGRVKPGGKDGSDSESSAASSAGGSARRSDDEEEEELDAAEALAGRAAASGAGPKLFEGDAAARDDSEEADDGTDEEPEDEGEEEEWTLLGHPILGRFFKMLATDGKPKADVVAEMAKDAFNPALLECDPNAVVPEGVAAFTAPIKDCEFLQKYAKMLKVGLPRPVVEHKMVSESVNPLVLDMDPASTLLAKDLTPPKKRKAKGPQVVRKKLHWVPIKGKIEATIWAGPPGDLLRAAAQLIDDEAEFARLFIQKPEDARKKKRRDDSGVIQLLDQRRAMNAGIALAKLKVPPAGVVACLGSMSARSPDGKHLLSLVELQSLRGLCPTDEELKLVQGFKGDTARLGAPERFFLAVAGVPQARARAEGLFYQSQFDDRVREAHARLGVFSAAVGQIARAARFQRLLKAVLVLGNKMNGVTDRKRLVKAFTLNSLHQLYLTKAWDQSTTVLQYLIRLLKRKDPDLLRLLREFKGPALAEAKRLPLDVMTEEMRDLRIGLTALETLVREAAQAGGGWPGMRSTAAGGEQFVEEEVEADGASAKEQGGGAGAAQHSASASSASDAGATTTTTTTTAAAAAARGGGGPAAPPGSHHSGSSHQQQQQQQKRRKKVRRRVEPLPDFAAIAQGELGKLQSAFDAAQVDFKSLLRFFKEDADMPADELFGTIHSFLQTFDGTLRAMIERKRKEREARRRAQEMSATKRRAARRQRDAEEGGGGGGRGADDDGGSGSGGSSGDESAAHPPRGHKSSLSSDLTLSTHDSEEEAEEEEGARRGDGDGGESAAGGRGPRRSAAVRGRPRPGWQDAPADDDAARIAEGDEEEEEEDDEVVKQPPAAAAAPRVTITATSGGGRGEAAAPSGGGAGGRGSGSGGGGGGGDPRAGLLAAIARRGGHSAATAAASPASPAAAAAGAGGSSGPAAGGGAAPVAGADPDPRAALMAMLAKRRS